MNWISLHHPDISLPIIRRRTTEELITLLASSTTLLFTHGASVIYGSNYPSKRAYQAATYRLKKKGLITQTKDNLSLPTLTLTPEGKQHLPPYYFPEKLWSKKWNKYWYILMFDVPEAQRSYRDTLRSFLKQNRFGQLQKSVWVTPRDVRPDYDDLDKAAAIDSVAFLFEAKTVLGHGNQTVVQDAWNFNRINQIQQLYIKNVSENLSLLKNNNASEEKLLQLMRIDNLAYSQAMHLDPLLPEGLLPTDYCGKKAAQKHRELLREIEQKL